MMNHLQQPISRRAFLGSALAAAMGLGGAIAYGLEQWTYPAPALTPAASSLSAIATGFAPLLLVTDPAPHPDFTAYLSEILRAEGFLGLRGISLRQFDPAISGAVIILGATPTTADGRAWLRQFVNAGGGVIGIRPDPALADLFGVTYAGSARLDDALYPLSTLAIAGPLQLHTLYDRVTLRGAEALAVSSSGDPLVTMHRFGQGMAALWTFDLARAVALIRQGNPAWADQERDLMAGIRASDMFVDWINLDRIAIPQADEHQRLLSLVVEEVSPIPLPRLWYLPANASAALIATGDAHGSRVSHIEQMVRIVERHGGTASIYYTPPAASATGRLTRKLRWTLSRTPLVGPIIGGDDPLPAPHHVADWRERGHEFGMHPYVEEGLEEGYYRYWSEFLKLGYGPLSPTVRTHRILWHGWVENAVVQARYGIRMNLDHYHSGPAVRKPDGTWTLGFLNGSGLPLRFVDETGQIIPVYQQATHLVDEHLMPVFQTGHEVGLDGEAAAAQTVNFLTASSKHYPAAFGLQCHVDPFLMGGAIAAAVAHWLDQTLAWAADAAVPILAAARWLAFVEARARSDVSELTWNDRQLQGTVIIPATLPLPLTILFPAHHRQIRLRQALVDGSEPPVNQRTIGGRSYHAYQIESGQHTFTVRYA